MHASAKQLKHPLPKNSRASARNKPSDQSWIRRFWLLLGIFALASALAIFFYVREGDNDAEEEVYVSVNVKTSIGINQLLICKLSLQIDRDQEKGIQKRQQLLEAVVADSLSEVYQRTASPKLAAVRQALFTAINHKLPRRLQVQDVLIQEILVGIG